MSIQLTAKVEALEKQVAQLTERVSLAEKFQADAIKDYLDAHFPLIIPNLEQHLAEAGYARSKKRAKGKNAPRGGGQE